LVPIAKVIVFKYCDIRAQRFSSQFGSRISVMHDDFSFKLLFKVF
jgi:hypothetical protein